MIGLAHLAAQQERRDDARALLEEAADLAESTMSHGVLRWVAGPAMSSACPWRSESADRREPPYDSTRLAISG